jgi:hypothetical protein
MNAPETRQDRELLIASLGIPTDAPAPREYIDGGGKEISTAALAALVDRDVAERSWLRWNSGQSERLDDPKFRAAFEAMLSAGVGLGYSIDRFQSASTPDADGERWVEPFERAVAARNALDLRVHVRRDVRDALLGATSLTQEGAEGWDAVVKLMSEGVFYDLGIIVPRIELLVDESLASTELRIDVNDARLPRTFLIPPDQVLVNDTVDRLTLLNIRGREAVNPVNANECATVKVADGEVCRQAGLTTWGQIDYAMLVIASAVSRMAGAFVNTHLVHFYCEQLEQAFPSVVNEIKKTLSQEWIAHVLRGLVDEEISIRNLLRVFEVLTGPEASISADLARNIVFTPAVLLRSQILRDLKVEMSPFERRLFRVRCSMARYISHKYTRGGNTLVVYLLDPGVERRLAHPRAFSPRDRDALRRAVNAEVGNLPPTSQNPVILTVGSIRRRLRREIASVFPRLAVLSYQELSPDMNIQPIARMDAPELGEPFARLGPQEEGLSPVTLPPTSQDPLITSLLAAKASVVAATAVRRNRELAQPLIRECLDAILGEVAGMGSAAALARALPARADIPIEWHKVVELILAVGRAACGAVERPISKGLEERKRFYMDVARIRSATERLARAVADAAIGGRDPGARR